MFRRLIAKSSSCPNVNQLNCASETSSSGKSSEHIGFEDVPVLKRCHSLVQPYTETAFLSENYKPIEVGNESFDPFDHPSLRRSKSIAEGMLTHTKKNACFTWATNRKAGKSVRFKAISDQSIQCKMNEGSSSLQEHPEPMTLDESANSQYRTISSFVPLDTTPQRSMTSEYSDSPDKHPRLKFETLKEYRQYENTHQRQVLGTCNAEQLCDNQLLEIIDELTGQSELICSPGQMSLNEKSQAINEMEKVLKELLCLLPEPVVPPMFSDSNGLISNIREIRMQVLEMVAKKDMENETLEKKVEQLNNDIDTMSHEMLMLIDYSLADKFQCLQEEQEQLQSQLDSFSSKYIDFESKLRNLINFRTDMERRLNDANERHTDTTERLFKTEKHNLDLTNNLVILKTELAEKDAHILELDRAMTEMNKSHSKALQRYQEAILTMQETEFAKNVKWTEWSEKVGSLNNSLIHLQNDLFVCAEAKAETETFLQRETECNQHLRATVRELQERCARFQKVISKMKSGQVEIEEAHQREINSQTLTIKKLIHDNTSMMEREEQLAASLSVSRKQIEDTSTSLDLLAQTNVTFKTSFVQMFDAVTRQLSDLMEDDFLNLAHNLLRTVSSRNTFASPKELTPLDAMIRLSHKAVAVLIEAFKRMEVDMQNEINNRNEGYKIIWEKLFLLMNNHNRKKIVNKRRLYKKCAKRTT